MSMFEAAGREDWENTFEIGHFAFDGMFASLKALSKARFKLASSQVSQYDCPVEKEQWQSLSIEINK